MPVWLVDEPVFAAFLYFLFVACRTCRMIT